MAQADLEKAAQADACVIGISHNHIYHKANVTQATFNDPDIGMQAHFQALNAFTAYPYFYDDTYGIQSANTSLPDTVVAIIDTGIDWEHPDLQNQIVTQDLGNGQIGWGVDATTIGSGNLIDYNPIDISTDSHGTHVSGLAAAQAGNGIGVSGTAPFRAKILAVKVFAYDANSDDGVSTNSTYIVNGLQWAGQNGANVVNMSLQETIQGPNTDTVIQYEVQQLVQANVFISVAMGNGTDTVPPGNVDGQTLTVVPAIYGASLQGMMAVASIDIQQVNSQYLLSTFSNWSSQYAEIATFGAQTSQTQTFTGLFSTIGTELNPVPYGYLSGTSMAAPLVAAAAALTIRIITDRTGTAPTAAEVETLIANGSDSESYLTSVVENGRVLDFMALFNAIAEAYPQTANPNYRSTLCGN
jgi:subtilisin family serine protease